MLVGEPWSGKSTLVSDYFRETENCVAILLSPSTEITQSAEYIRLVVAEQACWLLDGAPFHDIAVSEADYNRLVYRLQKHAKNAPITWIIDGIYDVTVARKLASDLARLIPFGTEEFRFIITGDSDLTPTLELSRHKIRLMDVPPVAVDEARSLFNGIAVAEHIPEEVRSACHSNVGSMQRVRELISDGVAVDGLLQVTDSHLKPILDFDWSIVPKDEQTLKLLAAIVFAPRETTTDEISALFYVAPAEIENIAEKSRLLAIRSDDKGSRLVAASSKSSRKYLQAKLERFHQEIREQWIAAMLKAADSHDSAKYLPAQLHKSAKNQQLVEYLTPDHFARILEIDRTLASLREHAQFGFMSARKIPDIGRAHEFAALSSAICGLSLSVGTTYQIEALINLGNEKEAFDVAAMALTREEQLQLLASAGNAVRSLGKSIPPELRDKVREIGQGIDVSLLGSSALELACNLLQVDAELAFDLMLSITEANKREELNLKISASGHIEQTNADSVTDSLGQGKTKKLLLKQSHQTFWSKALKLFARLAPDTILERAEKAGTTFGVFTLKVWLSANRRSPEAHHIASAALDLLLEDVTSTPLIEDLREIAVVLPHIADSEVREALCSRIETQHQVIRTHGTSVDGIRLRLQILRARFRDRRDDTEYLLLQMFYEIDAITELSAKVAAWAWFLDGLTRFDEPDSLEASTGLINDATTKLDQSLDGLLETVADHHTAARDTIAALARRDPARAANLVSRLNTIEARDDGHETLVNSLLAQSSFDSSLVVALIRSIRDRSQRDSLIVQSMLGILHKSSKTTPLAITEPIADLWREAGASSARVQAATVSLCALLKNDRTASQELEVEIVREWEEIPSTSVKVNFALWIAAIIAPYDRDIASNWFDRAISLSASSDAISESVVSALYLCGRLAARMYARSISDLSANSTSFNRLRDLIEQIPCLERRTALWSETAVWSYFSKGTDLAKHIVSRYICPVLDNITDSNRSLLDGLLVETFPALHLTSTNIANQYLANVDCSLVADDCRRRAIQVHLRRMPYREQYKAEQAEFDLDKETLANVLVLLEGMKHDNAIYFTIEDLCRSIVAQKNRAKIRAMLRVDYLTKMEHIATSKLPDSENITHDGYLVAAQARLLSTRMDLLGLSPASCAAEWTSLYERARNVGNVADRAVVTAIVGYCAKTKVGHATEKWQKDLELDLIGIPSAFDRAYRCEWIAKIVESKDKTLARNLLKEAANVSKYAPMSEDKDALQRALLDSAYAIDPLLSDQIMRSLDVDEARQEHLRSRADAAKVARNLADKVDSDVLRDVDDEHLADSCRRNLASLNAGRIIVKPSEEFWPLLVRAQRMSMVDAFPLWCWVIENRLKSTSAIERRPLESILEGLFIAADITKALSGKFKATTNERAGTIRDGERAQFLEMVSNWARTHNGSLIRLSDPYFGPAEIDILKLIFENAPDSSFRVAVSKKHLREQGIVSPEDAFAEAWTTSYDFSPPPTEFAVAGLAKDGQHPIHDRWIVTENGGLSIGSSIKSMGSGRTSDVTILDSASSTEKCVEIDKIFMGQIPLVAGSTVRATRFNL